MNTAESDIQCIQVLIAPILAECNKTKYVKNITELNQIFSRHNNGDRFESILNSQSPYVIDRTQSYREPTSEELESMQPVSITDKSISDIDIVNMNAMFYEKNLRSPVNSDYIIYNDMLIPIGVHYNTLMKSVNQRSSSSANRQRNMKLLNYLDNNIFVMKNDKVGMFKSKLIEACEHQSKFIDVRFPFSNRNLISLFDIFNNAADSNVGRSKNYSDIRNARFEIRTILQKYDNVIAKSQLDLNYNGESCLKRFNDEPVISRIKRK